VKPKKNEGGKLKIGDDWNAIRIIAETGLRVKRELLPMKKNQIDFLNAVLWIPDSKTPNGVAEIPLTKLAMEAFRDQVATSGNGEFLFPSDLNKNGHLRSLRTAWRKALKRAGVPYFRLYDLRSTYATRLSAGGVADEWVIQMLRQGDSQVFKKYSQMKLQMKREALEKINRRANEMSGVLTQQDSDDRGFDTVGDASTQKYCQGSDGEKAGDTVVLDVAEWL